jgi:hypothetical protein
MKIQYVIILFVTIAITLQNCNCGKGGAVDIEGLNQDSIRIADSIRQEFIKDSIKTDSINKAMGINVKTNELKKEVQEKVEKIIEAKTEASPLQDKTPEDIFKLYEAFVTTYNKGNKTHQAELSRWTSDPLFLALKKDDNWVEKIEELEAQLQAKK